MKNIKFFFLLLIFFGIFLTCENPEEPDTTPPVVSIQSPISGAKVSEIVKIVVSASDNKGIEKVEFYIDDSLYYSDFQEPYEYYWNTCLNDDNSEHIVKVKAYDESENFTLSQPILLIVDNISSYPNAIRIDSIMFENGKFTIIWNKSIDNDFQSYKLEKSLQNIPEEYDAIYMTNEINDTVFIDTNVNPLIFQYYRITVTDTVGLITIGEIKSSSLDPVPRPVNVVSVTYSFDEMIIEWEESSDLDFNNYKLLYSENENGSKDTLITYFNRSVKSHTLTEFDPTHENWFWISVTDTLGQSTIGAGLTNIIENPPFPSFLDNITYSNNSFYIKWSKNKENDFLKYTLYESSNEDMNGKTIIYQSEYIQNTTFVINGISDRERRYYQIVVSDFFSLETVSTVECGSSFPKIVYISESLKLFKMDEDGFQQTSLGNYHGDLYSPQFNPDGSKILFVIKDHCGYSICIINIDGSSPIMLTKCAREYFPMSPPQFSPDGTKITFISDKDGDYDIYIMNVDGSDRLKLTNNNHWDFSPRFSPDGLKIVFVIFQDIYTMDLNGSNLNNLTKSESNDDRYPRFTPDGLKILFTSYREGNCNIYIMDADGSNQTKLTKNDSQLELFPQLSPDGTYILYTSFTIKQSHPYIFENYEINIMDIDGSNLNRLTSENVNCDFSPQFSPDGSKVFYTSRRDGDYEIYVMEADGSNKTNLTNNHHRQDKFPQFQPRQ